MKLSLKRDKFVIFILFFSLFIINIANATETIWSATMTVEEYISDGWTNRGFKSTSSGANYGSLTNTTFNYDGTNYTISQLRIWHTGLIRLIFGVGVGLSDDFKNEVMLKVGDKKFSLKGKKYTTFYEPAYSWNNPGITFIDSEQIAVSLTVPSSPDKPTNLSATAGNNEIILKWYNPNDFTITNYQHRQSNDNGSNWSNWTNISSSDANTTNHTITELTNGIEYTFQIRAVNNIGNGTESDEVTATPHPVPSQPTNLQATEGNEQVTLTWNNPNNPTIIYYQYNQGSGWTNFTSNANTTSYIVTSLTNDQEYTLQVRAVNDIGEGDSAEITATPHPVPSQPTNFPSISITSPPSGTRTYDRTPEISFRATDNFDTNLSYKIFVDNEEINSGIVQNNSVKKYTLNSLSIGEHKIKVEVTNSFFSTSDEITIFVKTKSSGSSSSSAIAIRSWDQVAPQTPLQFNVTNNEINVDSIQTFVNNEIDNVKLTVEKIDEVSVEPQAEVFQYIEITKNVENEEIDRIVISFSADKDWLEENNFRKEDVILLRYESEWQEIETVLIGETETTFKYESQLPGFSVFAIGALKIEQEKTETPEPTEIIEPTKPVEQPEEIIPPKEPTETAGKNENKFLFINQNLLFILLFSLTTTIVIFVFRRNEEELPSY